MSHETLIQNPETLIDLSLLTLGVLGAFARRQKEWLRRRDTNGKGVPECQYPDCGRDVNHLPKGGLHAHHIIPAGWFKKWLTGISDDPAQQTENFAHNLIMLCADKHHNGAHGVHPDYAQALQNYRDGDKKAFVKVMNSHQRKEDTGEVYWDTKDDKLLSDVAAERTQAYFEKQMREAGYIYDPWPPE